MTLWNRGLLQHWEQTWLESRVIKMQKALDFAFYPCLILGQQAAEDKVFVDLRKVSSPGLWGLWALTETWSCVSASRDCLCCCTRQISGSGSLEYQYLHTFSFVLPFHDFISCDWVLNHLRVKKTVESELPVEYGKSLCIWVSWKVKAVFLKKIF